MHALPFADASSSALTLILPSGQVGTGVPTRKCRPISAAVLAAGRSDAGLVKRAPPPGAIGTHVLWAMMLVLYAAAGLRSVFAGWLW